MKRSVRRLLAGAVLAAVLPALLAGAAAPSPALPLTAEERAYIQQAGPIKVGYVQDRVPVSFQDGRGELGGISRYIFDRVAALSGLDFTYVPLPGGDVTYTYLQSQGFDLVTSVEYNKENLNARGILMSEPYLTSRKVVVARQGLAFDGDAALSVAISSGSQTIRKVLAESYPNFTVDNYDSILACFDAVRSGAADLMIQNQYVVEYWIAKPAYEGLKVIPVPGMDDQQCFSAVVAFEGTEGPPPEQGEILIGILNKAIAALGEDEVGTYTIQALMENQYTFTVGDFLYRYRYTAAALGAALCIIAGLVALLVRLRLRAVADRADAKAKGQFLSAMSHELRTPLNGLIGLNGLMAQNLDDREKLAGQLRKSNATAQYLLALVNDILDMSSLEAKKVELVLRPVELPLLLDTVHGIVEEGMAAKGLRFTLEADLPWPCILGDEARIQQVLLHLLDNARKFTPAGGQVALRAHQSRAGDGTVHTCLEVEDTGQGMSEDFQKEVFEAFTQELGTVSKGNQGTGLGLALSHSLAVLMGGELRFTSQKDVGSHFRFTFPAQVAAVPRTEGKLPPVPAADGGHILVAEDNELNAEIMAELLADAGYTVTVAKNGREAVAAFKAAPVGGIPVILMDLLMPEMDGCQASAAIRMLDRPDAARVCIIACTANTLAEDRQHALESGMNDFLAKPVDVQALLQKLAQYMPAPAAGTPR